MRETRAEDDVFSTIGFLNDVMTRYPDAISFAPGAPVLEGIDRDSVIAAIDAFVASRGNDSSWQELMHYGPSQGVITKELSDILRSTAGITATPRDIAVTVGAQEAFVLVLRALRLHESGHLGIVAPAFAGIRGAAAFIGAPCLELLEGPEGVTVEVFEQACEQAEKSGQPLKALYIAPDYSNPSGTVMTKAARMEILAAARAKNVLILEDSTYGFTGDTHIPSLKALDEDKTVIQIGTFSKVCMPGARVGFVVADQVWHGGTLAEWVAALKNMTTVNTPPISQAIVAGMLLMNPNDLTSRYRELAALYQEKRLLLLDALSDEFSDAVELGLSWNKPSGGFFVVLTTDIKLDHVALKRSALDFGVLWTPMRDFYADAAGDECMRLSCSYAAPKSIREGVRRLGSFLRHEKLFNTEKQ